ncbi:MAG: polysaccharide biosynthesis/export family protein [Hymenobacteraceae bacterium]|nr:polysaccharide biosynthesis/export family protein [Hymenobacteraceae bacterium]MDX5397203.1 polysaccharide biosynthesis/export family protein [Hymenobacteraceae bacterium]MDX5442931.1 polysaccharide biosynthesis/export family protein [Hymenobacteraceae bacterium]MDX5513279.1 polysaccharide biosynthesis/export family protein [Hymenobacteraceae bacterium]
MFKTDGDVNAEMMKQSVEAAEKNYVVQPNDYLDIKLYTRKGEMVFDPDFELRKQMMQGGGVRMPGMDDKPLFLVQHDGKVKLPMVGYVDVEGRTLLQVDSLLQQRYSEFYVEPFSITRVANNRIFVLGSPGGKVIPMTNDNMNLLEVLALAGGIEKNGKAFNIRLIRGDLDNPMVQVIDLSTIEGMRQASLKVKPNDVVYVEPVRRAFFEALADIGPIFSTVGGILTTYIVVKDLVRD